MSLVPVGFTSQISEYMEIADVLVTKAGPGTRSCEGECERSRVPGERRLWRLLIAVC